MLVLRTCNDDMTSYNGFVWPVSGPVSCVDWDPNPECPNGLHGLAWGKSDGRLSPWYTTKKWLVVYVEDKDVVDLDGEVKFPNGDVVFCGDRKDATDYIRTHGATDPIVGAMIIVGDDDTAKVGNYGIVTAGDGSIVNAEYNGKATVGDEGTATVGDRGIASAGDWGIANAGNEGMASVGFEGTASAGYRGIASAGEHGIASTGDWGTASARNGGTASAGDYGTAIAGNGGTASAGNGGTASVGDYGTASAGENGEILIKWHDGKRYRTLVGYIGENGLKPNVKYKVKDGKFVKTK